MTATLEWLPELLLFSDHEGNWPAYEDALYECFSQDFIRSKPVFRGVRLGLKRHPLSKNREATFWHLISEGAKEDERIPDMRRCERIRWPRPGIDNSEEGRVKVWETESKGETRIMIWLEPDDYIIVLAKRASYLLPWTAYVVDQEHRKKKLQRAYETYQEELNARKADAAQ